MRIEIVENIRIEPTYKSIFFDGSSYTLKIKDGSGDFNVALNSSIASFKQSGREVTIKPLQAGALKILIEDALLPQSPKVSAIILISDVEWLNLDSEAQLVEQTSNIGMNVTAFDSQNVEFDADQYQKMNFILSFKSQGVIRDTGLEIKHVSTKNFNVTGVDPGKYVVTASLNLRSENERITSKA